MSRRGQRFFDSRFKQNTAGIIAFLHWQQDHTESDPFPTISFKLVPRLARHRHVGVDHVGVDHVGVDHLSVASLTVGHLAVVNGCKFDLRRRNSIVSKEAVSRGVIK
jgi:hypothetical protein